MQIEFNKKVAIFVMAAMGLVALWFLIAAGWDLSSKFSFWSKQPSAQQSGRDGGSKDIKEVSQKGSEISGAIIQPPVGQPFAFYGIIGNIDKGQKMFELKINNPYPTQDRTFGLWIHYDERLRIYNTTYDFKAGSVNALNLSKPQNDLGLLKLGALARVAGERHILPEKNQMIFLADKVALDDFGKK